MLHEVEVDMTSVVKIAQRAARQWKDDIEANGGIEREVKRRLDARTNEVVGKLLGFDSQWGEWRVDHCNGRAGESAVGNWLREKAGKAVSEWLSEQAGNLPTLPAKASQSLRHDYLNELHHCIRKELLTRAKRDAQNLVSALVVNLTSGEVEPDGNDLA